MPLTIIFAQEIYIHFSLNIFCVQQNVLFTCCRLDVLHPSMDYLYTMDHHKEALQNFLIRAKILCCLSQPCNE